MHVLYEAKIERKSFFGKLFSFIRPFDSVRSYYEHFSSKEGLPRINISYCYVTFRSKVFQFIDCSFLPSLLFYISISFVFPRTKEKSSSLFIPRCKRELIILSLRISPILLHAKVEKFFSLRNEMTRYGKRRREDRKKLTKMTKKLKDSPNTIVLPPL